MKRYKKTLNLTLLTFFFILSLNNTYSQTPPGMPPCGTNDAPGETVCTATPICNLNGYCGQTAASYAADTWPELTAEFESCTDVGYDQGSIENNSFLSFVASSSNISFDTYVYDCAGFGTGGIQLMLFSADNCSSGPVTAYTCAYEFQEQNTPHNLTASGLTPGNTYYIMIDGYSGKQCNYSFVATEGVAMPTLEVTPGPSVDVCQGESVEVTASGGNGTYSWDANPALSATTGATVTITPPTTIGAHTYTVHSTGGTNLCPQSNDYTLTVNVTDCNTCNVGLSLTSTDCNAANNTYDATVSIAFNDQPTTGDLILTACDGSTQTIPVASLGTSPYSATIPNLSLATANCQVIASFSATPDCAYTLLVTSNATQTPTFTNPGPVCPGTNYTLPTTSLEGITGTWSPTVNTAQTTTYTFTPDPNQCAVSTTMTVEVNGSVTPTFSIPTQMCVGTTYTFPTTSNNGFAGTWSPTFDNTQTLTYTFTPDNTACAVQTTTQIQMNPLMTPTFNDPGLLCEGTTYSLPLSSNENITGTWSPIFNPNQSQAYTFTPNTGQCANEATLNIVIGSSEEPKIVGQNTKGCVPQNVVLSTNYGQGYQVVWNIEGVGENSGATFSHNFTNSGCFDVTVKVTSPEGCSSTATFQDYICMDEVPEANFSIQPGQVTTFHGTAAMENYSYGASSYMWDFGDQSPTSNATAPSHTFPSEAGSYIVTLYAYSSTGCVDTAKVEMLVYEDVLFFVPNAFTPDGNEFNNVFKPQITAGVDVQNYSLKIFNRWGELIFESHDVNVGWDGVLAKTGEIAQDGAYTWKIELKRIVDDEHMDFHGHFSLIR